MILPANLRIDKVRTKPSERAPVHLRNISELLPSPENDLLYRPVKADDPEVIALTESIKSLGVIEPIVTTEDDYIISGHRRWTAARLAGLTEIPCRTEAVSRLVRMGEVNPEFVRLLREYNRQRLKDPEEQAREAIASIDPLEAHRQLIQYRQARRRSGGVESIAIAIEGSQTRSKIGAAKMPMLRAAIKVIEENSDFWPLTLRAVHYRLLNDPPMRNASRPGSTYRNDRGSYQDLSDLLTRARHEELVPWEAIDDPTRPVNVWNVHRGVGPFVEQQQRDFLQGYYRDLMQGQFVHVEIVGEKNSVASILHPVAADYCIPLTLGRGYSSPSPRRQMVQRFRDSGRDVFALLVVSDCDPEGEDIAHNLGRSLRDEFGVTNIRLVRLALTPEQARQYQLPPIMTAKTTSSRAAKYIAKHGKQVYELEALEPRILQQLLRDAIEKVIDIGQFRRQQELERRDAAAIAGLRERIKQAILAGGHTIA